MEEVEQPASFPGRVPNKPPPPHGLDEMSLSHVLKTLVNWWLSASVDLPVWVGTRDRAVLITADPTQTYLLKNNPDGRVGAFTGFPA